MAIILSVARMAVYVGRWRSGRRSGTATVEYALLLCLLVVVGLLAWVSFGQALREALAEVVNSFNEAGAT